MSQTYLNEIDKTLLYISEARERAEHLAREIRSNDGDDRLAEALDRADRGLLDVHGELMRSTYFPAPAREQLRLAQ